MKISSGGCGERSLWLLCSVLLVFSGWGLGCGEPAGGIDPDACADGSCDDPPREPCEDVVCDEPPTDRCVGGDILRVHLSPGVCADDDCEYASEDVACRYGCDPVLIECGGCEHGCVEGDTRCIGGWFQTCEPGDDGCRVWSEPAPCEEELCADSSTCGTCEDQRCGAADGCCPSGCRARDDLDCPPPTQADYTTWVLHLSDLHFGDSSSVSGDLAYFLDIVVPLVSPVAVVNTGDTVDLGSSTHAWIDYAAIIEDRAPPVPRYFEIPGNHDVKDGGTASYLAHTRAGQAGHGLHGQTFVDGRLEPEMGRVRVVRANTSDSSTNTFNVLGIFTESQADELTALFPGDPPSSYTILAAHHPLTGLQRLTTGLGLMRDLVTHVGAMAYLCGHAHSENLSWYENTLVVQAVSLSKNSPPGFALVSLDSSGPAARMIELTPRVPWPVVMIASPADPDLGGGNPYALPFAPAEELDVRALAFDPAGIDVVEARLIPETWMPMSPSEGGVWSVALPLPSQPGEHTLDVRAIGGSGIDSRRLQVLVAAP